MRPDSIPRGALHDSVSNSRHYNSSLGTYKQIKPRETKKHKNMCIQVDVSFYLQKKTCGCRLVSRTKTRSGISFRISYQISRMSRRSLHHEKRHEMSVICFSAVCNMEVFIQLLLSCLCFISQTYFGKRLR